MRIRVSFEYGAGVCLWADDAAARERWCSAVTLAEAGLGGSVAAEGEALMAELERSFTVNEQAVEQHWTAEEERQFHLRAAQWRDRVAAALAPAGIDVAAYGAEPEPADEGPEFAGCVMAVFTDEEARAAADRKEFASFGWQETATWQGDIFKFREHARSPAELLALLEREPGFVCGWWVEDEGGESPLMAGDPIEHAVACVRARNATGLANFLSWLRAERVHLGADLAALDWKPTKQHRLADAKGSWWEWWSFARNAGHVLGGGKASARYLREERERLFWRWTHGGSRSGWPAGFGEALERSGLRRESFSVWVR